MFRTLSPNQPLHTRTSVQILNKARLKYNIQRHIKDRHSQVQQCASGVTLEGVNEDDGCVVLVASLKVDWLAGLCVGSNSRRCYSTGTLNTSLKIRSVYTKFTNAIILQH